MWKIESLGLRATEGAGGRQYKIQNWTVKLGYKREDFFFRVAEQLQMKEHLSVRPDQTFTTFFSAMLSVSKVLERKPESTTFSSKVSALFTGCSN